MAHLITLGYGPSDAGGYPLAFCECGWYTVSKDTSLISEEVANHTEDFYAGKLA